MSAWSPLISTLVRNSFCLGRMNTLVSDVHVSTASGSTPLHYAALRRDVRFVEFLLQQGVFVDVCNRFNETPLHWAVKQGHIEVVSLLISSGARVDRRLVSQDWTIGEDQFHLLPL